MSTRVMLDFDRPTLPRDFNKRLTMLCGVQGVRVLWRMEHRTRRGWHVVLCVTGRIPLSRVLYWQALLGSDWRREMFNAGRERVARRVGSFWSARINVLYVRHYRRVAV